MSLIEDLLSGKKVALSRAISIVENREEGYINILKQIYPHLGYSHVIGFTGPPGVGKSSLISSIAEQYLLQGLKVGIIAIDPTSPFSGGAVLGDRIRMETLKDSSNLFIRSMASRGGKGGLSKRTLDVIRLMDAFKMDKILVETVGVGQGDVEIINIVDTSIVVLSPNLGDDIQTMKAGILEIGDIFVVNKIDLPGGDEAVVYLLNMIKIGDYKGKIWVPLVIGTSTINKIGILELIDGIENHKKNMKENKNVDKNKKILLQDVSNIMDEYLLDKIQNILKNDPNAKILMEKVYNKEIDPYTASEQLLNKFYKNFE
ncbi:MAG: methylmalonyl Co-A mutase-associated GTPase MeaB [Thermoplasmata archaeon]